MRAPERDEPGETGAHATGRGASRWRAGLIALAVLLAGAMTALWMARKPIAAGYIDRYLRQRQVAARYRIVDLGLGSQRLVDIVIGDPAHPDLTADWIALSTGLDWTGARVSGLRAGHVRVNGRMVGGRLRFGALDRLLPAPSSAGGFALPKLDLDLADLRLRLALPQGVVDLMVRGRGRLDDGFAGRLAMSSPRLTAEGCRATMLRAQASIRTAQGEPTLAGAARVARAACLGVLLDGVGIDPFSLTLAPTLDRWRGGGRIMVNRLRHPRGMVAAVRGRVSGTGTAAAARGSVTLWSGRFRVPGLVGAGLGLAGGYTLKAGHATLIARASARAAGLPPEMVSRIATARGAAPGTPVAPLLDRAASAAAAALRRFDITADIRVNSGTGVRAKAVSVRSASGLTASLRGADAVSYDAARGVSGLRGTVALAGGGLPAVRMRLDQARPGAPLTGMARVAPFAAGAARLTLAPLRLRIEAGRATIGTRLTLSGPVGAGHVDDLSLPVVARWDGGSSRVAINPGCTDLGFRRLAIPGLVLSPARLNLCATGGALVRVRHGRVDGGAEIAATRLSGRIGTAPLALGLGGATLSLAGRGFALRRLALRIGAPEAQTRLDVALVQGRLAESGAKGEFQGGAGQIGHVPLLLSGAAGGWSVRGGVARASGALTVADAAATPRFKPLAAQGVTLTLAQERIAATGTLVAPGTGVKLADVAIAHDLADASGHADLAVPGIVFGPALQPDALTPLTYGVIADVAATVSGEGHIAWTPRGTTSTGVFRTDKASLAGAFGVASGITGEIRFTDLLAFESAPGQRVTIASVNPGVAVTDGMLRYQTLSGGRIRIEAGRWPFAGGTLRLEPTTLDFGQESARALTFQLDGVDAGQFLQQFGYANLNTSGIFDGTLPMIFDSRGGRIAEGRLSVREGGGTIAYIGDISQKDLGFWGNFAFQALRSLRYRKLDIALHGPLDGEMITEVRFAGLGQGSGARRNFLIDRLQKLPLEFNVRIAAPFRQLIDTTQSYFDPQRLIERTLPDLIQREKTPPPVAPGTPAPVTPPIQPTDSKSVP